MNEPLPLVGISCSYQEVLDEGKTREMAYVYKEYFDAISDHGGLPFLLPPLADPVQISKALDRLDGLLFIGGFDMDPKSYGQALHEKTHLTASRRNDFDLSAARIALNRFKFPLFCICQGSQVLNVVCGGDLIQHVPEMVPNALPHEAGKLEPEGHPITLEEGTRLHAIASGNAICVNSYHHQAIGKVGEGLRVAARCTTDGVIEAIELDSPDRFVLGVQWHPEMSGGTPELSKNLFGTFVTEARRYADTRH